MPPQFLCGLRRNFQYIQTYFKKYFLPYQQHSNTKVISMYPSHKMTTMKTGTTETMTEVTTTTVVTSTDQIHEEGYF